MFKDRMLKRMIESNRDAVTEDWRRLHNEELYELYSSLKVIWVIKSRKMRWARHEECKGRGEVHTEFWWGDLGKGLNVEDTCVNGIILLKLHLQEVGQGIWTVLIWLGIGAVGGLL